MTYRLLPPEEMAALSPKERDAYEAQRRAFDAEVAAMVAQARKTGVLDVPGFRFVLRCGEQLRCGRCLRPRFHDGDEHSPVWRTS